MRYADQTAVMASLKIKESDTAAMTRAMTVENGLASTFDGMTGRTFGVAPVAETRTIRAGRGQVLILASGIRSVARVETGGTWDGTTWRDSDVIAPQDYRLILTRDGVSYGMTGQWEGELRITGIWGDQSAEAVPADVREALTIATVKEYRRLSSSPQEMVGPDGMVVPTPSGLSDPQFKTAVERYRLDEVIA